MTENFSMESRKIDHCSLDLLLWRNNSRNWWKKMMGKSKFMCYWTTNWNCIFYSWDVRSCEITCEFLVLRNQIIPRDHFFLEIIQVGRRKNAKVSKLRGDDMGEGKEVGKVKRCLVIRERVILIFSRSAFETHALPRCKLAYSWRKPLRHYQNLYYFLASRVEGLFHRSLEKMTGMVERWRKKKYYINAPISTQKFIHSLVFISICNLEPQEKIHYWATVFFSFSMIIHLPCLSISVSSRVRWPLYFIWPWHSTLSSLLLSTG